MSFCRRNSPNFEIDVISGGSDERCLVARWECSLQGPHDDQDWRLHSLLSPPGGAEYRQVLHLGQRIGLLYEGFDGLLHVFTFSKNPKKNFLQCKDYIFLWLLKPLKPLK